MGEILGCLWWVALCVWKANGFGRGRRSRIFRKLACFSLCLLTFFFFFSSLCFPFLPGTSGLRLPERAPQQSSAGGTRPPRPLSPRARPSSRLLSRPFPGQPTRPGPGQAKPAPPPLPCPAAGGGAAARPPLATPPGGRRGRGAPPCPPPAGVTPLWGAGHPRREGCGVGGTVPGPPSPASRTPTPPGCPGGSPGGGDKGWAKGGHGECKGGTAVREGAPRLSGQTCSAARKGSLLLLLPSSSSLLLLLFKKHTKKKSSFPGEFGSGG